MLQALKATWHHAAAPTLQRPAPSDSRRFSLLQPATGNPAPMRSARNAYAIVFAPELHFATPSVVTSAVIPAYLVGIDLGTTHTVVAYARLTGGAPAQIELLKVPQLVGATEIAARELFPSFLYSPLPEESIADPWGDSPWALGEYARARGREVSGRQIASAKSWLCHSRVDRRAPILPWGSEAEGLVKLSPVDASARLLSHVRRVWDEAHPDSPLADQQVVLTLPASFDQAARELSLLAAKAAGLSVRLLEEPQAAFYAYLADQGASALEALLSPHGNQKASHERATVLVCDVGGGTTDLTLIELGRGAPNPKPGKGAKKQALAPRLEYERVAVGSHLLLGGDNLDLALAHLCERRMLPSGESLEPQRFAQLVMSCRTAKERLLGTGETDTAEVRLLGRGSALLGSNLTTELSRAEVIELLHSGFLPDAPIDTKPKRGRGGLVAFGLPYEADPAITHHIAWFLTRHAQRKSSVGEPAGPADIELPSALLLNGGLFRSEFARQRIQDLLGGWAGRPITLLQESDPDRAVARGAVVYGLALHGIGPRIGGGSARGYYVGVAGSGEAKRAICVVPKGAAEGEPHRAAAHPLSLLLGKTVRFELYASDDASVHTPGSVVTVDDGHFLRLPPVASSFEAAGAQGELRVELVGELSAIGTLELACEEQLPTSGERRRFELAFDLRAEPEPPQSLRGGRHPSAPPGSSPPPSIPPGSRRSQLPGDPRFAQAADAIDRVFGKSRPDVKARETKDLVRELERRLGERRSWSPETNRALFDALIKEAGARRRSADHERVFWLLAGFCLRPGFGYPGDDERARRLAKLVPDALFFPAENRNWQGLWVAWRRVAGGLQEPAQVAIRDLVDPFLAPAEAKLKKPKKLKPTNPVEMLELASSLERLPAERRAELGLWVLERTWTDRDPRLWEALARIGARNPTYASAHHVVPTRTVERWFDHVLRERWEEVPSAARAAVSLARVTEDRTRDLSEAVREDVVRRLDKAAASGMPIDAAMVEEWKRALREFVPLNAGDQAQFFGEELPVGLRLLSD